MHRGSVDCLKSKIVFNDLFTVKAVFIVQVKKNSFCFSLYSIRFIISSNRLIVLQLLNRMLISSRLVSCLQLFQVFFQRYLSAEEKIVQDLLLAFRAFVFTR